jgi:parallel beta-helix repeat protein
VLSVVTVADITFQSSHRPSSNGGNKVLYVNETGSGGAYAIIQEAVNDAKKGDTVFVFSGTYYENVILNKGIDLIGENRHSTVINGEGMGHVIKITAPYTTISEFTITESGRELFDAGLSVESPHVTISRNNIVNNKYGMDIMVDGICEFKIADNNISNNDKGLTISRSIGNNITGNDFHYNKNGSISFHSSSNNNLFNNNFSASYDGIYLIHSSNNIMAHNYFSSHEKGGIWISYSPDNTINNNIFENDGVYLHGKHPSDFDSHNITPDNTVNDKPLLYLVTKRGIQVNDISVGQIILVNCSDIILKDLEINNTYIGMHLIYSNEINISNSYMCSNIWCGIFFFESTHSILSDNHIGDNRYGVYMNGEQRETTVHNNITRNRISFNEQGIVIVGSTSRFNSIIGNNISNNREGLQLWSSWLNLIYHNTFMDNRYDYKMEGNNTWDNGYPEGGNYWDDYKGNDEFNGPSQDIPGSDGIGDTPYFKDNYPLIAPR